MQHKASKYSVYNITILSEMSLPELTRSKKNADIIVSISQNEFDHWRRDERRSFGVYNNQAALISFKDIATFSVREGKEVVVSSNPNIDSRVVRMFFHGVVTAILLYQRGLLVLHGSCMDIHGKAVGFLGESGSGKSTMAAGMHQRGYHILSEDIVAIDYCKGRYITWCGIPQLKLSTDVVSYLNYPAHLFESLYPLSNESIYRCKQKISSDCVNVECIFVLKEGEQINIRPLSYRDSFAELIKNSYVYKIIEKTDGWSSHFAFITQLLKKVPVCILERPRDLKLLPDISRKVEEFLMGLPSVSDERTMVNGFSNQ